MSCSSIFAKQVSLVYVLMVDRYKTHDIEIVVDRIEVHEDSLTRIKKSVQTAFRYGKGLLMVMDNDTEQLRYYSRLLMCPTTGLSYEDPEPNTFSFNSPAGARPPLRRLRLGLGMSFSLSTTAISPKPLHFGQAP